MFGHDTQIAFKICYFFNHLYLHFTFFTWTDWNHINDKKLAVMADPFNGVRGHYRTNYFFLWLLVNVILSQLLSDLHKLWADKMKGINYIWQYNTSVLDDSSSIYWFLYFCGITLDNTGIGRPLQAKHPSSTVYRRLSASYKSWVGFW